MTPELRRELFWFAALALALVGLRGYLFSQETVVFEGNLPDEKETLTPLFQVRRDTPVRIRITRTDGSSNQPLEIELFDADGRLLVHEPMFLGKAHDASDTLLFSVQQGEVSFRILRDVPSRDPLHLTVVAGAQSHQHFGVAFFALLAPPLFRYARRRRKRPHPTTTERPDHGT